MRIPCYLFRRCIQFLHPHAVTFETHAFASSFPRSYVHGRAQHGRRVCVRRHDYFVAEDHAPVEKGDTAHRVVFDDLFMKNVNVTCTRVGGPVTDVCCAGRVGERHKPRRTALRPWVIHGSDRGAAPLSDGGCDWWCKDRATRSFAWKVPAVTTALYNI